MADESYSWALGADLLVAPVVEQGAVTREVAFPAGCWQHGETGQQLTGGDATTGFTSTVDAPLDSLPWFVRCGTDPLAVDGGDGGGEPQPVVPEAPVTVLLPLVALAAGGVLVAARRRGRATA